MAVANSVCAIKALDITQMLLQSVLEYRKEYVAEAEKVLQEHAIQAYEEDFFTQTLKGLDSRQFERIVDNLQLQVSFSDHEKTAILQGRFAEENKCVFHEFKFKAPCGRFVLCRTVSMKRQNGRKIDFAYVEYFAAFKMSKTKVEVTKSRIPVLNFFLGEQKEIKFEDRGLDHKLELYMPDYFRKKCSDYLLMEYSNSMGATRQVPEDEEKDNVNKQ